MRAVQATAFGDPGVLVVVDLPDPTPGPGQIAIDVTHAAVGLIDLFFRQGVYRDRPGMPQPPFVPGLEVAGTVRALGPDVTEFAVGEPVVSMSAAGTGGYASVYIADAARVAPTGGLDPAVAVAVVPNAAMAHVALTRIAHLEAGESVLVQGALGGFSAAFPGIARQLGASRVVGTVRAGKLAAAATTKLPYDRIVDSAELPDVLADERFDVVIDPVGGAVRTHGLALLRPGGRMIVAGNASEDWGHQVDTNQLWLGNVTVAGFNAGAYLPAHPQYMRPALEAALQAVAAGHGEIEIDVLSFDEAVTAHERMERRDVAGRIVLRP
ncbi:quinone oxidoreductase family protein [Kutzneria sp. CA-103260]|uniref:quinone oxidoreductase family protein n=1 Tax=Kutzneria sp. CA-103260 TaxID=2802641 RepID=UPI001BA73810|nr:zinc-binding dehydrogenase [Kutzneria sp. CA-103260]QUQ62657.1 NADPH:quinone reductase-dependent oxidoreductase [Kutzneria sp. CA-103260]